MMRVAIITGATGGLGMEFTRVVNSYDNVDSIWAVGRNRDKLNKLESSYEEMGIKSVEEFCNLNCTVPAELISAVLPYMHEESGILNISSASSFQPNPYLSLYSASKVFLKNLSRSLYMELKPRKISVTAVCPGWIDTDMLPEEKNGKKIKKDHTKVYLSSNERMC